MMTETLKNFPGLAALPAWAAPAAAGAVVLLMLPAPVGFVGLTAAMVVAGMSLARLRRGLAPHPALPCGE